MLSGIWLQNKADLRRNIQYCNEKSKAVWEQKTISIDALFGLRS